MKILISITSILVFSFNSNAQIILDANFGIGGKLKTTFTINNNAKCKKLLHQSNEKIIAVGNIGIASQFNFGLARYTSTGVLDNTFGINGKIITDINGDDDNVNDAILQKDEKIIAIGTSQLPAMQAFEIAICRYDTNGNLDNTFGLNGKKILSIGAFSDVGKSIAQLSNGKYVIGAITKNTSTNKYDALLLQLNNNGSLDNTFNTTGYVVTPINSDEDITTSKILVDVNNFIYLTGYSNNTDINKERIFVAKFQPTGLLENSFGTNGIVLDSIFNEDIQINDALLDTNGNIFLAGASFNNVQQSADVFCSKYLNNGLLDNGFANNGFYKVDAINSNEFDLANSIKLQTDGKIYLAGFSTVGNDAEFLTLCLKTNGVLDTSFNHTGIYLIDTVGKEWDFCNDLLLTNDGKIILGGFSVKDTLETNFSIVQLIMSNAIPTSLKNKILYTDWMLYPNPAINKLYISTKNTCSEFLILDNCGREIKKGLPKNNFIEISDLNRGTYY